MAAYRGVEKKDVVQSITAGLDLLETSSLGPNVQEWIDDLRAPGGKLSDIATAQTDKELYEKVRASGAPYLFARLQQVVEVHALKDTDGKGEQIYRDLAAWSAFSGAMSFEYNRLDHEKDLWLLKAHAAEVADSPVFGKVKSAFMSAFLKATSSMHDQDIPKQEHVDAFWSIADNIRKKGDDSITDEIFDKMQLNDRYALLNFASVMSGLHADQEKIKTLRDLGPFQRFGLEFPMQGNMPAARAKADEVDEVLAPYYETGEVNMLGIGGITDFPDRKKNKLGITFVTTPRAAEAVAHAFPQDNVIDSKGVRLLPKPPAPPSVPKP